MKKKQKGNGFITGDYNHIITRRHDKMEALSVDIERKVKALVDAGYYSNKSEVIKNAVISLFRENTIEFKEILGKRGFTREIEARPAEEMDEKLRKYL